jgi:hypothetical protein
MRIPAASRLQIPATVGDRDGMDSTACPSNSILELRIGPLIFSIAKAWRGGLTQEQKTSLALKSR